MTALLSSSFDYAALPADIVAEAKAVAASVKQRMRGAIIDVGADLIRIKDRLPHGEFGKWLKAEFEMTERSAQRYMSAAALAQKCDTVSDLQPKTIYLLAAPSTPQPVQQEVLDRLNNGERVEDKTVRELVAEARFQEEQERRAAEAAREAKLSPRTRRSRAQREAEWEQERRDREAANAAAEAAARKAAQLIVSRLQPGDREQLTALIGTAQDHPYSYRFPTVLIETLTAAKDDGAACPGMNPMKSEPPEPARIVAESPNEMGRAEPELPAAPPPTAANAAPRPSDKGWFGKEPPVPCNAKNGLCNLSGCKGIGCCQRFPNATNNEAAA